MMQEALKSEILRVHGLVHAKFMGPDRVQVSDFDQIQFATVGADELLALLKRLPDRCGPRVFWRRLIEMSTGETQ